MRKPTTRKQTPVDEICRLLERTRLLLSRTEGLHPLSEESLSLQRDLWLTQSRLAANPELWRG